MNLSSFSTEDLANELAARADLLDPSGQMCLGLYKVSCKILPLFCTDGVAVRRNANGEIEAMAIRRGTGPFKGRLCSDGGRLKFGESVEDCIRRQFRTDVGCEIEPLVSWRTPVTINQAYPLEDAVNEKPPSKDWGSEQGKHTVANYYPVRLIGEPTKFGSTGHGGQEALGVVWFTLADLPPESAFGYGQRVGFVACLEAAKKLI